MQLRSEQSWLEATILLALLSSETGASLQGPQVVQAALLSL